jgi:hypothetical protein
VISETEQIIESEDLEMANLIAFFKVLLDWEKAGREKSERQNN